MRRRAMTNGYSKEVEEMSSAMWKRIGEAMENQGKSIRGFSAESGLTLSVLWNSLDHNVNTDAEKVVRISEALGLPVDYLVHGVSGALGGPAEAVSDENPSKVFAMRIIELTRGQDYGTRVCAILPYLTRRQQECILQHMLGYLE